MLKERYDNPRIVFEERVEEFIAIPFMAKEYSTEMRHLQTMLKGCATEFLRLNVTHINDLLTHFAVKKCAPETLQAWEHYLASKTTVPSYSDFDKFFSNRLISVTNIERSRQIVQKTCPQENVKTKHSTDLKPKSVQSKPHLQRKSYHVSTSTSSTKERCFIPECKGPHHIRSCPDFLARDCFAKKTVADQLRLCINCLGNTHFVSKCPNNANCKTCGKRHHTLLHFTFSGSSAAARQAEPVLT
ncbi:PREDICTED: uncharacterized protein LOC108368070 [Rhagoletis zephyria]|uniref:uncharacterized protein LOC108368070 n=1 Tax=Rhagoletis zephyria TaxID=28612 RepID=UPI0008116860|nr:PREDICTED: uncharacterized protein LOC108368070 [Rhagoletis zephyria]